MPVDASPQTPASSKSAPSAAAYVPAGPPAAATKPDRLARRALVNSDSLSELKKRRYRIAPVRSAPIASVRFALVRFAPPLRVRAGQLRAGQVRAGQVRELHIVLERRTTTELEDLLAERMDLAKTARRSRKTAAERKRDLEALVAAGPPRPKQRAKYCEYLQAANKLGGDPVPISSCTPNSSWHCGN